MKPSIHIVMQGKGGVGKSVIARLLQEYMISERRPFIGFDADPVNQTFAAHGNAFVTAVDLLDDSRIIPERFDSLMESIFFNDDKTVILDTGASSFLPFMEYFSKNKITDVLQEEGFEVFIHTVVTGATSAKDTILGFLQLVKRFSDTSNVIVWENSYFGAVELDGKLFGEIPDVKKAINSESVMAIIPLPKEYDLHEKALLQFLDNGDSFAEASAKDNTKYDTMTRRRLKQLQEKYVNLLNPVIGSDNNET